MNQSLAGRLAHADSLPFVQLVNRIGLRTPVAEVTANTLQSFLAPQGQQRVQALIARASPDLRPPLQAGFAEFLLTLKVAFAAAIAQVFAAGFAMMMLALAATLLLPVIALRRTHRTPALQEIGQELEAEFAQADPEHEPELD